MICININVFNILADPIMRPRLKKQCNLCNRDIIVNNYSRHVNACGKEKIKKIRGIDFDPNIGYANGSRVAWNKGRRSKPDTRNPDYIGKIGGYRANAGRSKKFKVLDSFGKETTLQSSYELICSEILNSLNIKWIRPKALKYNNRNYFADFYLVDYAIYLDPKNDYKAKLDNDKINLVQQQNNVRVLVLLKQHLNKEYITAIIGTACPSED